MKSRSKTYILKLKIWVCLSVCPSTGRKKLEIKKKYTSLIDLSMKLIYIKHGFPARNSRPHKEKNRITLLDVAQNNYIFARVIASMKELRTPDIQQKDYLSYVKHLICIV